MSNITTVSVYLVKYVCSKNRVLSNDEMTPLELTL